MHEVTFVWGNNHSSDPRFGKDNETKREMAGRIGLSNTTLHQKEGSTAKTAKTCGGFSHRTSRALSLPCDNPDNPDRQGREHQEMEAEHRESDVPVGRGQDLP